jgi:predicted kinase
MFCGKIASGKSTLAASLAAAPGSILLSEDFLLSHLYPGEIATLDDYVRATTRLRRAIAPHIGALLRAGIHVVLDFQANTPTARAWARDLLQGVDADHRLHYLRASDDECKDRLHARNRSGTHEYQVSDEDFDQFTRYFVPPGADEGFEIVEHDSARLVGSPA